MKYVLMPVFLVFAYIEYHSGPSICASSDTVLGDMWFMWLMMAIMCADSYIKKLSDIVRKS